MTPLAAVAVALVVWAIGLIRPVAVRALVYSLPVPMSLVLAGGKVHVDGTQVVGVVLLVAFCAATAVLHVRLRWPVTAAVVAAAGGYVTVAWALPARLPLLPCLAGATALWLTGILLRRRTTAAGRPPLPAGPVAGSPRPATGSAAEPPPLSAETAPSRPPPSGLVILGKLAGVLTATFAVVWLAGLLAGLVVTFPYSGVLVAVEVRRELVAFTWAFARTSIALVAFLAGFAGGQGHGTAVGLVAGWLAFGVCAVALRRPSAAVTP